MGPQPSPPRFRGCFHTVLNLATILILGASSAKAQTGPQIEHDGLRCVLSGEHLVLEAVVGPANALTTVKAYFRANIYTQYYYVEMELVNGVYRAVLPRPSPEINGLNYYLEAVDASFNSIRTEEYTPQVVSDETSCRERNPTPAVYLDGTGAVTVGATTGGPALPPGFLSEGIAGTIPLVGRAAATSGGSGLLIGGAAAAGAAVGVGVLVAGGDSSSSTTSTPVGVVTTSATTSVPSATTTPPAQAVMACFETSPSPPRISPGGTVRFDATCSEPRDSIQSYVWNFNDGRGDRDGRVVNRRYPDPGVFGAVLTVTALSGEQDRFEMDVVVEENAPPGGGGGGGGGSTTTVPGDADLSITSFGPPGNWPINTNRTYTVNYSNAGPDFDPSVSISTTFSASGSGSTLFVSAPGCSASGSGTGSMNVFCFIGGVTSGGGGSISITVQFQSADTYFLGTNIQGGTSDPVPGNNSQNLPPVSASLKAGPGAPRRTRATSYLELPPGDGTTQARVTFNESRTVTTDNSGPSTHEIPGRGGENTVEGYVLQNPNSEGTWRFDFQGAPGFVPGSIVIDAGQVVSREPQAVVFRVAPGVRRVRFRFALE